ncbi:MAG: hypothetical protein HKN01_01310 [Acidimicrobiia bacterium]|nr:hypothetical protein [Acidimicrobiia bacterium]
MFLDRLTSLLGFMVIGVTGVGYVLGLFGALLLGPTLILGAVAAYTLWTLWWGVTETEAETQTAAASPHRMWPVVVAVAAVTVLFATSASGFGVSLGTPDAQMTSGLIAADRGELTVPDTELGAGTSAQAPGWLVDDGEVAFDGGRYGVAAIAVASWFGNAWAHQLGVIFVAMGLLAWGTMVSRYSSPWVAPLVIVAVGITPAMRAAAPAATPAAVAFGLVGFGVWALAATAETPTRPRAAIAGGVLALSLGALSATGWMVIGGVAAWAAAWRFDPAGWIERDRRRRTLVALAAGAGPVLALVLGDAVLGGRIGNFVGDAGIVVLVGALVGAAGVAWYRSNIRRPASPLPLLVIGLAIPVSMGLVTFTTAGVTGGWGGPSVDGWVGIGPALVGVGVVGWLWWSDRTRDDVASLVVTLGVVAGAVTLVGPITLLPGGFEPFVPVVIPSLAMGGGWLIAELFGDPERPVLQTTAVVCAAALIAVPVWAGRDRLATDPQPGAVEAVTALCDELDSRATVVVVAEEDRLAGAVAAGVSAYCSVTAFRGEMGGDVDTWRTAAVASGGSLTVVGLDDALPGGVVRVGPTLSFEVVVPTIGSIPTTLRSVTLATGISGG